MSRQLDLQIYLAKNGYELKEIPEERFEDYRREPHYSTDGNAMLELDREMLSRDWQRMEQVFVVDNEPVYHVLYWSGKPSAWDRFSIAETNALARALAAYKALTGKEWEADNANS